MDLTDFLELHSSAIRSAIQATCEHWRVSGWDADDLAMDLWVLLLRDNGRALRHFQGRCTIGTYLFRVLNRAAGKWVRRRARRARLELAWGDTYAAFSGDGVQVRRAPSRSVELLGALEQAFSLLPEPDRALLALRRDGLSNTEIARFYGTTNNAIDLRIRRAIVRLRATVGVDRHASGHHTATEAAPPRSWALSPSARGTGLTNA